MIPYEVDPSLHPAQPAPPQLDDGFSPPGVEPAGAPAHPQKDAGTLEPPLWEKSEF